MAPEQAQGLHHAVDERPDVYLLGAVLYEMLPGHVPHLGPPSDPRQGDKTPRASRRSSPPPLSPASPADEIPASRHDVAAPTRTAAFIAVHHDVAL
jgi:serine/threonine protein kinase